MDVKINVALNEAEFTGLVQLIDVAVKAAGLQSAKIALVISERLDAAHAEYRDAMQAAQAQAQPASKRK